MLTKKKNSEYNPYLPEINENTRYIKIKDCQWINDEFHKAFQKIYAKQDVDDSSEAIQDFLDSGNDKKPSEYLANRTFINEEKDKIEGEITLDEMHSLRKWKAQAQPALMASRLIGYRNSGLVWN